MYKTPRSSQYASRSRADTYATGLTNANLFQTDFAALERRQCLNSIQRRMAVKEALARRFHEYVFMYQTLYRTIHRQGPVRGLRPALLIIKRDLEAHL